MEHLIDRAQLLPLEKMLDIVEKLTSGEWEKDDVTILNPYEMELNAWLDYSKIIAKTYRELNSGACNRRYPDLKPGHEIIQWPLFWLYQTFALEENSIRMPDHYPSKLFCSMNGRIRPHRDALWGQLAHKQILNLYCSYIGKGVTIDLAEIENISEADTIRSHSFPPFYKDILIDLVCETHTSNLFFTEKTWKPFLAERIPLLITAPGAYKKLKDWGFEDYTEIFDYSFDTLVNFEDRVESIVAQLKVRLEVDDPKQLYLLTKEKREHNRENCLKIIKEGITPELAFEDKVCLNALRQAQERIQKKA